MPNPIQSTPNSSSYLPMEGASAEENNGQVCLSPVPSIVCFDPGSTVATAEPSSPASPAVTSLVARFTPPTGSHPPVEPSLSKAIEHCSWETANAVVGFGSSIFIAPSELTTALASGARALIGIGTAARCIQRDEAQQVAKAEISNQSADCVRDGAMPLLKSDGSVICASQ